MMSKVKHENLVKVSVTLCLRSFYLDVLMVFYHVVKLQFLP